MRSLPGQELCGYTTLPPLAAAVWVCSKLDLARRAVKMSGKKSSPHPKQPKSPGQFDLPSAFSSCVRTGSIKELTAMIVLLDNCSLASGGRRRPSEA